MKDALRQVVSMLPDNALVGVVTFGAHVIVHELGFQHCGKQICFQGTKVPNSDEVIAYPTAKSMAVCREGS